MIKKQKLKSLGSSLRLPHEHFVLDNGLTVLVHSSRELPRSALNMLYRVGAAHDPHRRRGLAHLFEHLMFMGTARVPEGQFDLLMEQYGGSNNAFTSEDFTSYHEEGPGRMLETFLWLEADRLATFADNLTQKKLDLQREVVINELRQSYENEPYGRASLELPRLLYPRKHPYSWPIIGSIEDLRDVTVEDTRRIFRSHYAPANAVLVVAGDIDVSQAKQMVTKHFAWIPAAPTSPMKHPRPANLRQEIRRLLVDKVELPKIIYAWHSPAQFSPGDAQMDLAADLLSSGKQSRLHRRLVYDLQLAVDVSAMQESRRFGSQFVIDITLRSDADAATIATVEKETAAILKNFIEQPIRPKELACARNCLHSEFVARLEVLSRRAEQLAIYQAQLGRADAVAEDFARYEQTSAQSIKQWARDIIGHQRRVALLIVPPSLGKKAKSTWLA